MTPTDIRERKFEEEIEAVLLGAPVVGASSGDSEFYAAYSLDYTPGGYNKRTSAQYDKARCLLPDDAVGFVLATQPKEWEKLKTSHPEDTRERFLNRLAEEVARRGTLEVLRNGIKLNGCSFKMAHFKPSSGLNAEVISLYRGNLFGVLRQWEYSEKNKNSIDMGIFLNGLPVFSAELKNPLTGQSYRNAIKQYQADRDPREPLFAFGRCLAHFAVDPDEIYLTTRLQGPQTHFLPFNLGRDYGAGNPPSLKGYATEYLWHRIWSRDSVLDLVGNFIQLVEEEDEKGKKTGKRTLLFPRFHQLECVRSLLSDAQISGAGKRYLVQHSAGSGKSNTIAWLAHQLTSLHDATDKRVFDSIVVVTDRRVLDRQLRRTVRQFQQVDGVVEAIDKTSAQLQTALQQGKQVIVTTLQKFGVIVETMGELKGSRFAVLVDEAHSSQSGETSTSLKLVLAAGGLEEAEKEEGAYEESDEFAAALERETAKRGWPKNVSFFAFTATPKPRTLELFGTKNAQGVFEPFSLYTMRQAIEEGFIVDVLQHYSTYKSYYRLLKTIEDDPRFEKNRAQYLLKRFVNLSAQAIGQKVAISVEHFHQHVEHLLGGRSKAMIVTRSRLHAVRFKLALDKYLTEQKVPFKALVAFSGEVDDREAGEKYTEAKMNGFPEAETAERFKGQEYRFMVVAEKFQTGFDQPLLCAMYVDKRLGGVNAVQTLSRLNRMVPGKDTFVLDFVNEPDDIRVPFENHYCKTVLTEATNPDLLYDIQNDLEAFKLYTKDEVDAFNREFLKRADQGKLDQIYALLNPVQKRFAEANKDDQIAFKGKLKDFARLYAFVAQIANFKDPELEKLYNFTRILWRRLLIEERPLPQDVLEAVDLESYRLQQAHQGAIKLQRGKGELDPAKPKSAKGAVPEQEEPLSAIIRELNDRYGMGLADKDKVVIETLEKQLKQDDALKASADANPPESFKLSFEAVARERFEELADSHMNFYKRFNDDEQAAAFLMEWLMSRYLKKTSIKRG